MKAPRPVYKDSHYIGHDEVDRIPDAQREANLRAMRVQWPGARTLLLRPKQPSVPKTQVYVETTDHMCQALLASHSMLSFTTAPIG